MLSTENPSISDLPCPSQLKSSSSDDNQHVDLFKSGLDHNKNNNPSLPNFSIRDYVFNTRAKDIKTNWPFTQKKLQLCLKHGVKDVLPPFHSLDLLRNPSTVENMSYSDVKLSALSQKLNVDIDNINSTGSEEDKEFPTARTSQSCSDINSALPVLKRQFSEKAENLPGFSTEKPAVAAQVSLETNIQNPVKKKRRFTVKSGEDLAVNTPVISETMASKVCPVCKTFSSSSNTTLNAHIDQCLSGESTIKRATNLEVVKHRIKPRKIRSMVDIYETALHSTLEDLDRRNGTNWASNLRFPARDFEACAEEKNKKYCPVNSEDANKEGAVYIDSNGKKLCILSKLTNLPSNANSENDCGSSKLVKGDEEGRFLSSKKKNYLLKKRKLSPRLKYCPKLQVNEDGQQKEFHPEGNYKKENLTQPLIPCDHMNSYESGIIKQCVGSKRTGIKKKIYLDHENQHPGKIIKNSSVNSASKSSVSSDENPLSPTESRQRKENVLCNSHDDVYIELPRLRKRPGFSLLKAEENRGKKFFPWNGTEDHVSSPSNKKMLINITTSTNADSSFISSRMSKNHAFSSQSSKFASLKKKNFGRKCLDLKNPRLHYTSGSDEDALVSRSTISRQDNPGENAAKMEKASSGRSLINGTRVLNIQKKRKGYTNTGKLGNVALKGSETSLVSDSHDFGRKIDSFKGGSVAFGTSSVLEEVESRDEFIREPTYEIANGEDFIAFSKSLDSAFSGLAAGPSIDECVNEAQGNYHFVDVDPIPIPGPPGSFLPSPGRMDSEEELQGNSSLTTCRIHSSEEDEREFVDMMDSSDSPISATSLVSNSVAARSESLSFINFEQQNLDQSRANLILPEIMSTRGFKISEAKYPNYRESPSPSTSNPVLRLMGKNLMVVNKDENMPSPQTRPTQSSMVIDHPGNIQNEHHSFHHASSREPFTFNNMQSEYFDFNSSNDFIIPSDSALPSTVMLSNNCGVGGSFSSGLKCREYVGPCNLIPDQLGSNSNKHKEIIVIDEYSPEREADLAIKATHCDVNMEPSVGISASMGHVNPFYTYLNPPCSGSPMVRVGNSQVPALSRELNANLISRWNCNPEGSSLVHPNSIDASLRSRDNLRSSLYYSPGFS